YELPWSPTQEIERRFRRVLQISLIVLAVLALIIPFLPAPHKTKLKPEIPERLAKMIVQRQIPPPPPPPPLPKPDDTIVPQKVPEAPKPQPNAQDQAKKAIVKLQDALADLRDIQLPENNPNRELIGTINENSSSERNLITSNVGRG